MTYISTIELFKEDMKFSAGHFTVFSATERERLHGHNFKVKAALSLQVSENGMAADYNVFKNKVRELCNSLDEYFLLPLHSPYLNIKEQAEQVEITHGEDKLLFYKKDVKLLPIANSTVEELARYLTEQLVADQSMMKKHKIHKVKISVASGEGQYASFKWSDKPNLLTGSINQ